MSKQEHHHAHTHEQANSEVISKKWGVAFSLGSLAVGTAEVASSIRSTITAAVDGMHNIVDAGGSGIQVANFLMRDKISERKAKILRGISHGLTSASALVGAGYAAYELYRQQEDSPNIFTHGSALSSLALSSVLALALQRKLSRQRADPEFTPTHDHRLEDIKAHLKIDLGLATAAVSAPLLQKYGHHDSEQLLAAGVGTWGAWHFRPTRANLENHGHGEKLSKRTKAILAVGLCAITSATATMQSLPTSPVVEHKTQQSLPATPFNLSPLGFDELTPLSAARVEPPKRLTPHAPQTLKVKEGWGWYHVMAELDVPSLQQPELLRKLGPEFARQGLAYRAADEWRITKPGALPQGITLAIQKAAQLT